MLVLRPETQCSADWCHQTLKNRILLENFYLPGALEAQIEAFVGYYNHQRYHESIQNLTPADVYFGRAQSIIKQRERIKRDTITQRRLQYQKRRCLNSKTDGPDTPLNLSLACLKYFDDGQSTDVSWGLTPDKHAGH